MIKPISDDLIQYLPKKFNEQNLFVKNITRGNEPMYKNATELVNKIVEYFNYVIDNKLNPTLTGCALYLGFSGRQSMYDLESRNDVLSYVIKRARTFIEHNYENGLFDNKRVTGSIFALKQFKWFDNQKITVDDDRPRIGNIDESVIKSIAAELKKSL